MFRLEEDEFREAVEVLKGLLRFDTTNPPGNERPAADYVAGLLREDGIESRIVESAPDRANLVARLGGGGGGGGEGERERERERPLLLSSHLDVVPANADGWARPPFSGAEADDCVWGRGAVDMKGMTAMGLTVMRLLKRKNVELRRDVVLAAVADEEAGCEMGSGFLVREHPELIDAEYVINEVGGFTMEIEGRRFYPVQVAEKGLAWLKVRVRGEPGHSSMPAPDSCLAKLGRAMHKIGRARLPVHVTPVAETFIRGLADNLPGRVAKKVIPALSRRMTAGPVLDFLVRDPIQRASMQALLCNTANPTMVRGGTKINVLPDEAEFEVDGRILPGQTAADLVKELRDVVGREFEFEVIREMEATVFPWETQLFEAIREVITERDPEGIVLPSMIPGFTDSSQYGKTGAICHGFYPLKLPEGMVFQKLFHGVDERIPLESFRFGIEALYEVVARMAGK